MKKTLKDIALYLVLVTLILTILIMWNKPGKNHTKNVLIAASKDDVTGLVIDGTEILLLDGKWVAQDNFDITLDKAKVDAVVAEFCPLIFEERVNLSEFTAYTSIGIIIGDNPVRTFWIGGKSASGCYIHEEGTTDFYTITIKKSEVLLAALNNLRNKNLYTLTPEKLTEIKFGNIFLTNDGNEWNLANPFTAECKDETVKKEIIDKLSTVSIKDFVEDAAPDLALYGLDKPRAFVSFKESDSDQETIYIGSEAPGGYYVKTEESNAVYIVTSECLEFTNIDPRLLIDRFVYSSQLDTIDSIEIIEGSGKYLLSVASTGADDTVYRINNIVAENVAFKDIVKQLMEIPVSGELEFLPEKAVDVQYTVKFTNGKSPDVVQFVPCNAQTYAVYINGDATYYVDKTSVSVVIKNLREFAGKYEGGQN